MISVSNFILLFADEVLGGNSDEKVIMGLLDGFKGDYLSS